MSAALCDTLELVAAAPGGPFSVRVRTTTGPFRPPDIVVLCRVPSDRRSTDAALVPATTREVARRRVLSTTSGAGCAATDITLDFGAIPCDNQELVVGAATTMATFTLELIRDGSLMFRGRKSAELRFWLRPPNRELVVLDSSVSSPIPAAGVASPPPKEEVHSVAVRETPLLAAPSIAIAAAGGGLLADQPAAPALIMGPAALQPAAPAAVAAALGHEFRNVELLRSGLTHASVLTQPDPTRMRSNERWEFLGDSLLGGAIALIIFQRFPTEDEGKLTLRKHRLASGELLAERMDALGLLRYGIVGLGGSPSGWPTRVKANLAEGLLAAIFLDGGFDAMLEAVKRLLGRRIDDDVPSGTTCRMRLQELVQRSTGRVPEYQTTSTGPPHAPEFRTTVFYDGIAGLGRGSSKKTAELMAAEDWWACRRREEEQGKVAAAAAGGAS